MDTATDVRATFLRFPGWTQHFWTWFTGKALSGQEPLWRPSWYGYLARVLLGFFGGLSLSALAIADLVPARWPVLLLGWGLTVWSSRTMILVIAHQCIHRQFSGSARMDAFCGELVTALTVFQDAHAFKVEHIDAHHSRRMFASEDDPPVQVLIQLGFRPGMQLDRLWRQAWWVFLTPGLYWRGFRDRLRYNLTHGGWRRAGFIVWIGFWLSVPFWVHNGLWVLLFAFAIPVIPVAQLSALLDKLGEHAWLTPANPAHGLRHYHCAASWARFCGDPVPSAGMPWPGQGIAWLRWVGRALCYHLPARLFVIVGDLPNHDHHHRHPGTPDWMVAAYARQRDLERHQGPPYVEVWGMAEAMRRTFQSLSRATSASPDVDSADIDAVAGQPSHPH